MITNSIPSISDHLSLEQTVARLKASPRVDGIAAFGSHAAHQADMASDYDLLLLVDGVPARVFQMVTTIDRRLADIVMVELETADTLLQSRERPKSRTFEALFAQKMATAQILHDVSGRLHAVQQLVIGPAWASAPSNIPADSERYAAWFWQTFGLLQLERMAQSQDRIHLAAVDLMLTSCLVGTWRSYFDIRGIAWEGEKAALRYWAAHDPGYFQTLNRCLAANERGERLTAYRDLVTQTLAPIGKAFEQGQTAVILADPRAALADVERALQYWNSLFDSSS